MSANILNNSNSFLKNLGVNLSLIPSTVQLFISFIDLTNFSKNFYERSPKEAFNYISSISKVVISSIHDAGGLVLKFIGDSALIIFGSDDIDRGVKALLDLKKKIDEYNKSLKLDSTLYVKCHTGEVAIGYLGLEDDLRLDIMGNEVNVCAMMKTRGFAISAETFRKLTSETRKLFKKHTPPIIYIPLDEAHKYYF